MKLIYQLVFVAMVAISFINTAWAESLNTEKKQAITTATQRVQQEQKAAEQFPGKKKKAEKLAKCMRDCESQLDRDWSANGCNADIRSDESLHKCQNLVFGYERCTENC